MEISTIPLSMYQASVPVVLRGPSNFSSIPEKVAIDAAAREFEAEIFPVPEAREDSLRKWRLSK
jgi:hypothetical protein